MTMRGFGDVDLASGVGICTRDLTENCMYEPGFYHQTGGVR